VLLARSSPWGGSTNISLAFDLILAVAQQHELPQRELPDLIVFSDMLFDQAAGSPEKSQTQLEQVREKFEKAGYSTPRLIFWNLRAGTVGFPAQANDSNVQLLSGYSPALLKYVLEGEEVPQKKPPTPYETLRKVLDSERYSAVRRVLDASEEGLLAHYSYSGGEEGKEEAEEEEMEVGQGEGEGDEEPTEPGQVEIGVFKMRSH
jgi:hypothetical protein